MFANLKAQAASAANALAEQANKAAADVKARVDVAQAGKKLLDEGGEGMKLKLYAKQASQDACLVDYGFTYNLPKVIGDYKAAVPKMQAAGSLPSADEKAFKEFGETAVKRAAEFENVLGKVQTGAPNKASLSPAESDAISILWAKNPSLPTRVRGSFSGGDSNAAPAAAEAASAEGEAPVKKGMLEMAQDKVKAASDAAKERYEHANTGKKMVDEGGEEMKTKLLAKKASYDTVTGDNKSVVQLAKAVSSYRDAEAKLRAALPHEGEESPSFTSLADSYHQRADLLEALLQGLSPLPLQINTHQSEKDGILYLVTTMQISSVSASASAAAADAQGRVVEAGMNSAVAGATGRSDIKVPEGSGKAGVQYAKENPEQAKAAMQFAASAAAESGKKGGGY